MRRLTSVRTRDRSVGFPRSNDVVRYADTPRRCRGRAEVPEWQGPGRSYRHLRRVRTAPPPGYRPRVVALLAALLMVGLGFAAATWWGTLWPAASELVRHHPDTVISTVLLVVALSMVWRVGNER